MIQKNLEKLMKLDGNLSLSELARFSKVPQPTLHHILSGNTKRPRKNALISLAEYFHVSLDQLVGKKPLLDVLPKHIQQEFGIFNLPIITWLDALHWPELSVEEVSTREHLLVEMKKDLTEKFEIKRLFALKINKENADTEFPEGAVLIFDIQRSPKDGDMVLVELKTGSRLLFARLVINNQSKYLALSTGDGETEFKPFTLYTHRIIAVLTEARLQY